MTLLVVAPHTRGQERVPSRSFSGLVAAVVGSAFAIEYRAYGGSWGFMPEDVPGAVRIHQGTEDRLVPEAWAHELGRRIPGATVTIHPGGGHLIPVTHRREILDDLVGP